MNYPKIITKLPGPKAKEIIERDSKVMSPSYTRGYPFVMKRGRGAMAEDVDGNQFLDLTSGIATCSTGHSHPEVVKAIQAQAEDFIHMSGTDFYYSVQSELAAKLASLVPGDGPKKVFFGNSGTEAIEAALKLARYHTGRQDIIAFFGAFHGRTMGALSLTASKVIQHRRFAPLLPGVVHVPYGYCYRCPYNLKYGSCETACITWIEDVLFRRDIPPDEVAAIFVEPIQGEGGYVVPPVEFMQGLRRLADKHGILLVCDEVQSGMGRTGKMFASEHFDVVPDIICVAKGIASGMPLSAIIASDKVMDWPPGAHANTFGGNPLACVAALTTIRLLEEGLMENAATVGAYMLEELWKMQRRYPQIGDVRGLGLMIGIEIVKDTEKREPDSTFRDKMVDRLFEKGLLILGCGANSLRICPSLTFTREEASVALELIEDQFRIGPDRS
ncbi:MAG: acetyl ornithine aminotransferase family protein [Nitrospirota bacterium]|nr:acetyl ornithine aminotransferase family protein [Nitrospirota bacterium]